MLQIKVTNNLWKFKANIDMPIKQSIFEISNKVRNAAVINAPFKSWALRKSINYEIYDNWFSTEIWTNLKYAAIQEYWGTIKAKNKPYLTFKIWWKWIRKKQVTIKGSHYFQKTYDKQLWNVQKIFEKNIKLYLNKSLK